MFTNLFTAIMSLIMMTASQAAAKPVEEKKDIENTKWSISIAYTGVDDRSVFERDDKTYNKIELACFKDGTLRSAKMMREEAEIDVVVTDGKDVYGITNAYYPKVHGYIMDNKYHYSELWTHLGYIEVP